MRKINIGVAVAPPNVVHTAPYVAKALGFFAKRCIDANIIQFDGGAAGTSVTAVGQGSAISNLPDTAIAQGLKARQIWGLAPRPPQAYVVSADIKTPADLKGKRLSAAGGIGGFNWLVGRAALREGGLTVERRPVHLAGHGGAAARLRRRPDRRRRAAPGRPPHRAGEEARRSCAGDAVGPLAQIQLQRLWRRGVDDRQGSRPPARHHRGDDRGEPRHLPRQGRRSSRSSSRRPRSRARPSSSPSTR